MISSINNYKTLNDLLSKNNFDHIGYDEWERLTHICQLEYFDDILGSKDRNLNGQSRVDYGRSQKTDKRLEPFREVQNIDVIDGEVILPLDCAHIRSVTTVDGKLPILRTDEDRLAKLNDDPFSIPSEDEMYYLEEKRVLDIFSGVYYLDKVKVRYLREPSKPKLGIKEVIIRDRVRYEFDEATTLNLEWGEREESEILTRQLAKKGLSQRDGFVQNVTTYNKSQE